MFTALGVNAGSCSKAVKKPLEVRWEKASLGIEPCGQHSARCMDTTQGRGPVRGQEVKVLKYRREVKLRDSESCCEPVS